MLIENSPERICAERYNPYRTNILEAFEIEDGVLELRATTEFTIEKCDGYKLKNVCLLMALITAYSLALILVK